MGKLLTQNSGQEEDQSLYNDSEETVMEVEGIKYVIGKGICYNFSPSPYPMYVAMVLLFIPLSINNIALDDMLFSKICYLKYANLTMCADDGFTSKHQEIQKEAADWGTYNSLATLPLSILMNLMLSSYCDRVGHKLPFVLPVIGSALATAYLAILASPQFVDWPIESVFGYSFFYSCFGSHAMIVMASFSYIGLASTRNKRTFSMAIAEGALMVGVLIGNVINGPIIDKIGLANMLYVNTALSIIPLPIVLIFLTDVTVKSDRKYTWRDMIGVNHLLDAIRCVFKKRNGKARLLLNLCFTIYTCGFVAADGFYSNLYLYFVREREISLTLLSAYNGYVSSLRGFGGPIIIFLLKKYLNPDQVNLGIISTAALAVGLIIIPIDYIPYSMWIGGTFLCMQVVFFAIIRSLQIGFVEKDELGKMFAYDAVIQTVMGSVATISIKAFYAATLSTWGGMFLELCAILYILALVLFVILYYLKTVDDRNKSLANDNDL